MSAPEPIHDEVRAFTPTAGSPTTGAGRGRLAERPVAQLPGQSLAAGVHRAAGVEHDVACRPRGQGDAVHRQLGRAQHDRRPRTGRARSPCSRPSPTGRPDCRWPARRRRASDWAARRWSRRPGTPPGPTRLDTFGVLPLPSSPMAPAPQAQTCPADVRASCRSSTWRWTSPCPGSRDWDRAAVAPRQLALAAHGAPGRAPCLR